MNVSKVRIRIRPWCRLVPFAAMAWVAAWPTGAAGQRVVERIDALPPAEAVHKLITGGDRAELGATRVITAAFMHDRMEGDVLKVGNYTRYTAAQRQEFLDGLEAVALGHAAPEGPTRVRAQRQAAMMLAAVGLYPDITAPEKREIPRRLLRVFEESRDREARQAAASWLGDLLALAPPESPRIVEALMRAARASGADQRIDPSVAVQALVFGGELGNNAMRRLHEEGGVQGESAWMWLDSHAHQGFPVRRRYPVTPGRGPGG